MKLSEAMRAGAKLRPSTTGYMFSRDDEGNLCSCAVGAAIEAIAEKRDDHFYFFASTDYAKEAFPQLRDHVIDPFLEVTRSLFTIIVNLNDSRGWTRETIADWLEGKGY